MPTVALSPTAGILYQAFTNGGLPLNAGYIYTYGAGGTTPKATYTTSAGNVANANPLVLDASGRPPSEVWLIATDAYRFDVYDSLGNILKTYDNVPGMASAAALAASSGASLVGFLQAGTGAVATTVQAKERQIVSVMDFGVTGDGSTDDTAKIQAANDAVEAAGGGMLYFPKPASSYAYTTLTVDSGYVNWAGTGKYASTLKCTSANGGVTFTGSSLPLCGVQDLGFSQSVDCVDNTKALLKATGVFRFTVDNCYFNGYSGASNFAHNLLVASGNSVFIRDCEGVGGKTSCVTMSGAGGYFMQGCLFNAIDVTGAPLAISNIPGGNVHLTDCDFLQGQACTFAGVNISRVTNCYFDSAQSGVSVSSCEDLQFIGCEFANRVAGGAGNGIGVVFGGSKRCSIIGGSVINCGTDGVQIDATSVGIKLDSVTIDSNNISNAAAKAGVQIAAGAIGFQITNCIIGNNSALYAGHQKYGIAIAVGASDHYLVSGNDCRNNETSSIIDGGTGTNARVIDNDGYNPVVASADAAGGSPFNYTSGHAPETVYVYGGTMTLITVAGVGIFTTTDKTIAMGPNETITITYPGAAPNLLKVRH